jgi:hypothetical protein
MQREQVYDAWAPPASVWSLWAKPVLFVQMLEQVDRALDVSWVPRPDERTLLVVDLPGAESVRVGLALARFGYRPVPLFNACPHARELVDQTRIQRALHDGAAELPPLGLADDAPPAFLLDSLRQTPIRPLRSGNFDNRWRVYPDDFPTVETLRARGFTQMVLVQEGRRWPADDLRQVFWRWQDAGIALEVKDTTAIGPPQRLSVPRPWWLQRKWEGLLRALGLNKSPAGGFGHVIAEPSHG